MCTRNRGGLMCDHCGDIWDRVDDAYDRDTDERLEALDYERRNDEA